MTLTLVRPDHDTLLQTVVWDAVSTLHQPFNLDDVLVRLIHVSRAGWFPRVSQRRGVIADLLTEFAASGQLRITDRRDQRQNTDSVSGVRRGHIVRRGPVYQITTTTPPPAVPRPEPVAFFTASLSLQIPATQDGLWSLIRWHGARDGSIVIADLIKAVADHIDAREVRAYCRALEKAGVLTHDLNVDQQRFKVDLRHVETPRLRPDGSVMLGPRRNALLWRSIKMLGLFTADNLAMAASLPDFAITPEQARRYADDLTAGGYLLSQGGKLYRLKPDMNTGPAAPRVLRARFVWDANLCRVMGATAIDEVKP
jgi:hypothetical protein